MNGNVLKTVLDPKCVRENLNYAGPFLLRVFSNAASSSLDHSRSKVSGKSFLSGVLRMYSMAALPTRMSSVSGKRSPGVAAAAYSLSSTHHSSMTYSLIPSAHHAASDRMSSDRPGLNHLSNYVDAPSWSGNIDTKTKYTAYNSPYAHYLCLNMLPKYHCERLRCHFVYEILDIDASVPLCMRHSRSTSFFNQWKDIS